MYFEDYGYPRGSFDHRYRCYPVSFIDKVCIDIPQVTNETVKVELVAIVSTEDLIGMDTNETVKVELVAIVSTEDLIGMDIENHNRRVINLQVFPQFKIRELVTVGLVEDGRSKNIQTPHLEGGDKIIMPPSALDRLASLHIEYPMLFEIRNPATDRESHCGVLEFVADEGMIYMPYWMMENMLLQEGDIIQVKSATLSKGTYVKLQPHTKDFLDISNPKAILETTLRNYSCLTTGDTIMVAYNNRKYYIDIVETKPSSAISIIETDCEVDFAPPLDYKEPERPASSISSTKTQSEDQGEPVKEEPRFNPFTGLGRRLDGKLSQPISASVPKECQSEVPNEKRQISSDTSSRQHPGKLVFGSSSSQAPKDKQKAAETDANAEPQKKEEPKFQPFTGKKYSLRG